MVSTVKARNHYETLGLEPGATADEIERAFAREIGLLRPRAFGDVGQVGIAYRTLSDPVRRRAYDAWIGVTSKPQARRSIPPFAAPSFVAPPTPSPDPAPAALRAAVTADPPRPAPEPGSPRTASAIASALHDLAREGPPRSASAAAQPAAPQPAIDAGKPVEASFAKLAAATPEPPRDEAWFDIEEQPTQWKKPAIAVGGVVLAVAAIGALAGLQTGNHDAAQPESAVTVPLPQATDVHVAGATSELAPLPAETQVSPAVAEVPVPPEARHAERRQAVEQPSATDEQPSEPIAVAAAPQTESESSTDTAAAVEALAVPTAAAKLPLPDRTVARTIHQIGYACGEVASTTPVEGEAPGVFKVTCTSGNSYKAAPIRGRYHFRRWGRE